MYIILYCNQGFSKIHDRYEFPMRLELDSFVEPQSSPAAAGVDDEGGNIKPLNNFILHSVLIHAVSIVFGVDAKGDLYLTFCDVTLSGRRLWRTLLCVY